MPPQTTSPLSSLWQTLASVKLAVALLIILAASAVLGTVLPQGQPQEFYLHYFPAFWAKISLALQLDHVYTSWWFIALVSALGLNLIVCSLERLPRAVKEIGRTPDPAALKLPNLRLKKTFTGPLHPAGALKAAREAAAAFRGWGERIIEGGEGSSPERRVLFVQAGRLSRLGAYVVHLAILILFAAGLVTGLAGFKSYFEFDSGEIVDTLRLQDGRRLPLGFKIRLDKFIFEKYPDGTPKTFRSNLSFLQGDQVVRQARVEVNSPVTFGGITFYQSGYPMVLDSLTVELDQGQGGGRTLTLPNQGRIQVEGLGSLEVLDFAAQWRGIGPAAKLRLIRTGSEKEESFIIFSKPPYQMRRDAPEVFRLKDFSIHYASGLQANRDPGVVLLWLGGSVMLLGLLVALFWSHRRLWIEVGPQGQGSRITLAASAHRNQPALEKRIDDLAARLEAALSQSESRKGS